MELAERRRAAEESGLSANLESRSIFGISTESDVQRLAVDSERLARIIHAKLLMHCHRMTAQLERHAKSILP